MQNTQIYHLSHTDLDGYGAQKITEHYFSHVKYYNSNYGREINERFLQIISDIKEDKFEKNIILITDLNLTLEQCKFFESNLNTLEIKAKIFLLDHHKSGADCASEFAWYFLDDSRCATKITYDFFSKIYGENEKLAKFSSVVNSIDIWLEDDPYFELGKVCLGLIANAKEINRVVFLEENNTYMSHILDEAQKYFDLNQAHIYLEDNIHFIKKSFFKRDKNDTLSNLISTYMVDLLDKYKDKMTVNFNSYKGLLTYNVGNVSVIGNEFLTKHEDYDFFMDVTSRKTVSFRSNNKADVSLIAKKVANGGGHPNASGGAFPSFKDSFLYEKVHEQIQNILKNNENLQKRTDDE